MEEMLSHCINTLKWKLRNTRTWKGKYLLEIYNNGPVRPCTGVMPHYLFLCTWPTVPPTHCEPSEISAAGRGVLPERSRVLRQAAQHLGLLQNLSQRQSHSGSVPQRCWKWSNLHLYHLLVLICYHDTSPKVHCVCQISMIQWVCEGESYNDTCYCNTGRSEIKPTALYLTQ